MISPEQIAKLREVAQKATPGPWRVIKDALDPPEHWVVAGEGIFGEAQICGPSEAMIDNPDFNFIATFNPAVILELLDAALTDNPRKL